MVTYTPTAWVNGALPAINATNLGKIETALADLFDQLAGLVHDVKADHGAVGNGSTDDTGAFQAAHNACDSTGGIVWVPPGTYIVSSVISYSSTVVMGVPGASILKLKNSTNNYMYTLADTIAAPTAYPHDHQFHGIRFDLNKANNTTLAAAIRVTKADRPVIENCWFTNFNNKCVWMGDAGSDVIQPAFQLVKMDNGDTTNGVGIFLGAACHDSLWDMVDIGRAYRGVIVSNGGAGNHTFNKVLTWGHSSMGMQIFASDGCQFNSCTWDRNFGDGINIQDSNGVTIVGGKASNNSFDDTSNVFGFGAGFGTANTADGIVVNGTSSNVNITGVVFRNPDASQRNDLVARDTAVVVADNCSFNGASTAALSFTANARLSVKNSWGVNPEIFFDAGNSGTSKTIDRVNGDHQKLIMTGSCTFTFTAGKNRDDILALELTQDGSGSRIATWPSNFKKAGGTLTLSTAIGATDLITARWDGTNWVEVSRALNVS